MTNVYAPPNAKESVTFLPTTFKYVSVLPLFYSLLKKPITKKNYHTDIYIFFSVQEKTGFLFFPHEIAVRTPNFVLAFGL
jgi:hypothetical protein